jgi:hypothetical protein
MCCVARVVRDFESDVGCGMRVGFRVYARLFSNHSLLLVRIVDLLFIIIQVAASVWPRITSTRARRMTLNNFEHPAPERRDFGWLNDDAECRRQNI